MVQPVDGELATAGGARPAGDVAIFFDPASRQHLGDRLFDRESNPYGGDNILAPYAAVYDCLTRRGFPVHTMDLLPPSGNGRRHIVISFGTPDRLVADALRRYEALAHRSDVVFSAFFAMECPVVEPKMFAALPRLQGIFRRVLSWSDTDSLLPFTKTPVRVEHFCWPQSFDAIHEHLWSRRERKFLVMMNANKLPRLFMNELYTARLRAVEFFNRYSEIDLYGRNWDRMPARVGKVRTPATLRRLVGRAWLVKQRMWPDPIYAAAARANRGPALSKSSTLAQYRFALCFENSVLKGWITEKLFDCFFAGTIPVYWGAPDVLDWVPAEAFIDMRQFRDFADLRAFLHALSPADEDRYRQAARAFVASERFAPFRVGAFVDLVMRIIRVDTGMAI